MKSRSDRRETENIMCLVITGSYGLAETYLETYKTLHGENKLYRQMKRALADCQNVDRQVQEYESKLQRMID